ncbi:primase-helicase family protein [Cecembia lonarensis]|uniref:NrS-1 polymerase-like helicase domain-containing protein n=1 Tax=Cecembia lonarensis (strain CCUG 58316 / KCTC 22772 / LW9) TaxID=1225176 RepID=K1LU16_CECL9|nr:DUF5906 domain-containing protein [Cecembia lonarensis]EKB47619.1 hypothetical protein B879_03778 [Cecembia lonarensis LW9]
MDVFPAWMPGTYNRVHAGGTIYNVMNPLQHDFIPGRFDNTIKLLNHLFRGDGSINWNEETQQYEEKNILGDPFSVILDYLTIQFQYPERLLPVPILVSKENKTGKTTFLEWLKLIYGENATIMAMDRLQGSFNLHYAWKYIIGLDEGQIAVEVKREKEKLKQMATASTIQLEAKGIDTKEIKWYGKLIICSNFADSVIKIDEGENRWFVVKVPRFDKEDNKLKSKLENEIPAWIDYISKRKIFHPDETRIWFDDEYIKTDQYYEIIKNTRDKFESIFDDWIKDQFLTYKVYELKYTTQDILKLIKESGLFSRFQPDAKKLSDYLASKGMKRKQKPEKYSFPVSFKQDLENGGDSNEIQWSISSTGRPFVFTVSDWISEQELDFETNDLNNSENQKTGNLF